MKEASPMLLPLLRSRTQGDIITWIMLHPDSEFSLVEIANAVGTSAATVMREVDRLADSGLIRQRRQGNQRLVRADTSNAVFGPLASLLAVTFGPVPVLRALLASVEGVREAYVYGSWAARHQEHPGPVPADIDVLVIGTVDLDQLENVARDASQRLGREVNVRRVRPAQWDAADGDPFKTTVTSRPLVDLIQRDAT